MCILALWLLGVCGAWAQTIHKGDKFWDGETLFEVIDIYGGITVKMVAEGEIYLSLEKVEGKTGEYVLAPSSQADEPTIHGAEFGWRVQYIRQDGMNFLAVRKPNGDTMHTLVLTPDNFDDCEAQQQRMEEEVINDLLQNTLLNRAILAKVTSKKHLRLLRNEILARHGYRFQAEDLQEWFEDMPWYRPGNDNQTIKLNIIEQTNVEIIKSEEADRHPVTAESIVGEWRWVGKNVPELILVLDAGNKEPLSNGLKVKNLYRYRIEDYKNPGVEFDGENIRIRKDLGENTYIDLYLKPVDNDLAGRCIMIGIMPEEVDTQITLRRNYFEYDNK